MILPIIGLIFTIGLFAAVISAFCCRYRQRVSIAGALEKKEKKELSAQNSQEVKDAKSVPFSKLYAYIPCIGLEREEDSEEYLSGNPLQQSDEVGMRVSEESEGEIHFPYRQNNGGTLSCVWLGDEDEEEAKIKDKHKKIPNHNKFSILSIWGPKVKAIVSNVGWSPRWSPRTQSKQHHEYNIQLERIVSRSLPTLITSEDEIIAPALKREPFKFATYPTCNKDGKITSLNSSLNSSNFSNKDIPNFKNTKQNGVSNINNLTIDTSV